MRRMEENNNNSAPTIKQLYKCYPNVQRLRSSREGVKYQLHKIHGIVIILLPNEIRYYQLLYSHSQCGILIISSNTDFNYFYNIIQFTELLSQTRVTVNTFIRCNRKTRILLDLLKSTQGSHCNKMSPLIFS